MSKTINEQIAEAWLRESVTECFNAAIDNGERQNFMASTPEDIAQDMLAYDVDILGLTNGDDSDAVIVQVAAIIAPLLEEIRHAG